jgi:hypothetical protein
MTSRSSIPEALRRREFLKRIMAGAFGAGGASAFLSHALAKGDLPPQGIARLEGTVTVNGQPARAGTPVTARDKVVTGPGSTAVVVVKDDAFLMREGTRIEFTETNGALSQVLLANGRLLSVFGSKKDGLKIKALDVTVGIRGTGAYFEIEPARVYFCLCYGDALIEAPGMEPKAVKTRHHEQPLFLTPGGGAMLAEPGPFRNHSDAELVMLESLVGRAPPFAKDKVTPGRY